MIKLTQLFLALTLIAAITLLVSRYTMPKHKTPYIKTPSQDKIKLLLADEPAERYQGLSHRQELCPGCGMLFMFDQLEQPSFVMREMNFPLDLVWLKDNQVMAVSANLEPDNDPLTAYQAPVPINRVLEINAGLAQILGLEPGSAISYHNLKK